MGGVNPKPPVVNAAPEVLTDAQRTRLVRRLHALMKHLEGNADAAAREVFGEDAELANELGNTGDASIAAGELERDLATLGSASDALAQARAAAARVRSGKYGRCENCDTPIGYARLEAQPAATRCLACQRDKETRAARRT
jgi:RNA polymerase-binding transcription factor DksA